MAFHVLYNVQLRLKILCYTFIEDFANSSVPAAKRTKSESKAQVKDSKRTEKENDNGCENKAAQRRCNLLLIFKITFCIYCYPFVERCCFLPFCCELLRYVISCNFKAIKK